MLVIDFSKGENNYAKNKLLNKSLILVVLSCAVLDLP